MTSFPLPAPADPGTGSHVHAEPLIWAVVARRWRLVLATVVACAIGGLAVTLVIPAVYEATATVQVSRPKLAEGAGIGANVANFRAVLQSSSLKQQTIKELGLDEPPLRMTPMKLERSVRIEEIRGTDLIRIVFRARRPELAAGVANRLMTLGIDMTQRLSREQALEVRDYVGGQLEIARKRLDTLQEELMAYRRQTKIEMLRKEIDALLEQRRLLPGLEVEIGAAQASLKTSIDELGHHQKTDTLTRSIDSDPILFEVAKLATPDKLGTLQLQLRDQVIDRTYEQIDQRVAETKAGLAGLERKRQEVLASMERERSLGILLSFYEKETKLSRLILEHDLASKTYTEIALRYEQANLQVVSRTELLQAIDAALAPERPVFPKWWLDLAIGLVAGLFLGVALAFLLESRGRLNAGA